MSEFKIGDRVRAICTSGGGGVQAGDVFVVTKSEDGYLNFFNHRVGRDDGWGANYFELALTIATDKFYRTRNGKVTGRVSRGDTGFEAVVDGKVRIYDASGGHVHGDADLDIVEAWVPRVGERVVCIWQTAIVKSGEIYVVVEGHGPLSPGNTFFVDTGTEHGPLNYNEEYFEPLPVAAAQPAAALKIEAGKFYRTRDGRKVGPVDGPDLDGDYYFEGFYRDTGHWMGEERNKDYGKHIIAEWVDEPVVVAAPAVAEASNDNKPKFGVGDRVRSIENGPTKGLIGEVIDFDGSVIPYLIRFYDFTEGHGAADNEWWLQASDVDVATSTTAIVALIEDGQPKPADRPYVHTSEEAAATEAKRLAGIHKGKQFGVFVLTTTAEEAKPTYRHEWQRLAADGQKIAAIKELRSLTGMTLKPAKDVVEHFIDYPYNLAA